MHTGGDTITILHFLLCVPPVCSLYTGQTGVLIWGTRVHQGSQLHQKCSSCTTQYCILQYTSHATWLWHQGYGSASVTSWSLTSLVTLTLAYSGNQGCPLRRFSVLGQPTSLQTFLIRDKTQLFLHLKDSLLRDSRGKRQRSPLPHVTL